MKLFIKIALLLLLPVFVSAQQEQKQLDSLHVALKNAANDTLRMDLNFQLGIFYLEINFDSSLIYLNRTIPLAQKLKLKIKEADALELKGYMLYKSGNYPSSLESFLKALKIAEDPSSEKYTWDIPKGQTPENVRLDVLGFIYHNMGHLYGKTGNTKKQISNYYTAISLAEVVQDSFLLSLANMNLGNVYLRLNKLDSALLLEKKALNFITVKKYKGVILNITGDIYRQKGNYNEALIYYQKAAQANIEQNNLTSLGVSYDGISELYDILQKPDSSLYYARKGLANAKIIGQPQYMARVYKLLSDVYSSQQNRDSTLKYLQLFSVLRDSLNNVDRKNLLDYQNITFKKQLRLEELEKEKLETKGKIRIYSLLAGLFVILLVAGGFYRQSRQKQKANKILQNAYTKLQATQSQLIHSEKMASLGELTAGIAHEIQNPLNFVNNFSEVNMELISELEEDRKKEIRNIENEDEIIKDIKENEQKINHHGKRADAIVKGMLQHSRAGSSQKEATDINALADEYLRLAYHGLKAKDKSFQSDYRLDADENLPKVNLVFQDIGRVLLNLINNAFYAVSEKQKLANTDPSGFENPRGLDEYKPVVTITTKKLDDKIEIRVKDNGNGVPKAVLDKIFQPFFTTKPSGQGTGLGLSLSYDIIKAHGGEINVETKEGEGTEFIIILPNN